MNNKITEGISVMWFVTMPMYLLYITAHFAVIFSKFVLFIRP